jgi:hypothetical protein
MQIFYLSQVGNQVLVVFYEPREKWQFRVIHSTGEVCGQYLSFSSYEAALLEGRQWLELPAARAIPLQQHQQIAVEQLLHRENSLTQENYFTASVSVVQKYRLALTSY